MTLDKALQVKEKWKTKFGNRICKHKNLIEILYSRNEKNTGYVVCLECGKAHVNPHKPHRPEKLQALEELTEEDNITLFPELRLLHH